MKVKEPQSALLAGLRLRACIANADQAYRDALRGHDLTF